MLTENLAFHYLYWLYHQFSLPHQYVTLQEGWENVLFELGSGRLKQTAQDEGLNANPPSRKSKRTIRWQLITLQAEWAVVDTSSTFPLQDLSKKRHNAVIVHQSSRNNKTPQHGLIVRNIILHMLYNDQSVWIPFVGGGGGRVVPTGGCVAPGRHEALIYSFAVHHWDMFSLIDWFPLDKQPPHHLLLAIQKSLATRQCDTPLIPKSGHVAAFVGSCSFVKNIRLNKPNNNPDP